jgi:hypothetical protein
LPINRLANTLEYHGDHGEKQHVTGLSENKAPENPAHASENHDLHFSVAIFGDKSLILRQTL